MLNDEIDQKRSVDVRFGGTVQNNTDSAPDHMEPPRILFQTRIRMVQNDSVRFRTLPYSPVQYGTTWNE